MTDFIRDTCHHLHTEETPTVIATCRLVGHDYTDPTRPEDGTYGWRACACGGDLPAHSWGGDPVDGNGCGMAWRLCRYCDHIDERPLTELHDTCDDNEFAQVQPGGSFRQDVAAGLVLPNHHNSVRGGPRW